MYTEYLLIEHKRRGQAVNIEYQVIIESQLKSPIREFVTERTGFGHTQSSLKSISVLITCHT